MFIRKTDSKCSRYDAQREDELTDKEPAGFRPPTPPPTEATVTRRLNNVKDGSRQVINVGLVGHHSLWAHCLWNAGVVCAHYLDQRKELVRNKRVLELGAAAGVPSIVAALNHANRVVATDYPDIQLIQNLKDNLSMNLSEMEDAGEVVAKGYLWGDAVEPLEPPFDLILLCDLIFNHSEHLNMLKTCRNSLASQGTVLVFFSSHRPWLQHKDLAFFDIAKDKGWNVEKIWEEKCDVMFENDPGDVDIRRTVFGYSLTLP